MPITACPRRSRASARLLALSRTKSAYSVRGVRVTAAGGFDADTWRSTGIVYAVEVDAQCSQQELNDLLATVDAGVEIPKAIRAGTTVERAFPQRADLKEEGYSRLGEFRPAA
jgi:hypothetical protein